MRITTPPQRVRSYTQQEVYYTGRKIEQAQVLTPQKGFIKCPRCLNGVAKQSVDAKDLVWDCVMCGWSKPVREPERRINREAGSYDTKRY